jgi:hypothetical protein
MRSAEGFRSIQVIVQHFYHLNAEILRVCIKVLIPDENINHSQFLHHSHE